MSGFISTCVKGDDVVMIADACASQLGSVSGHHVGFIYVTDELGDRLGDIVHHLRRRTGVENWFGTVGIGVCGTGIEYFSEPAVSVLTCDIADGAFKAIPSLVSADHVSDFVDPAFMAALAVVHADPRNTSVTEVIAQLARQCGTYLVGGLSAAETAFQQVSAGANCEGGVSGVLLGGRLRVSVGLTQGCSPIGSVHTVTRGQHNIIASLEDRPAYEVLCEDLGVADGVDPRPWLANVHAAILVPGSDTGDYLVRNLAGLDPEQGLVAIGDEIEVGDHIVFVRRDAASAEKDMNRMLADLKTRMPKPARAGLYYSCVARGPNLFSKPSSEMLAIRDHFGDIPIAGFFGNGEISNDRVYGYTGVLTLFY